MTDEPIEHDELGEMVVSPPVPVRVKDNPLRELLPRQRRFLKAFIKCHSRTDAWMKVYRCKSRESAMVGANRFLHDHPEVVDWLYQLSGLGDDDFATVVREGLRADKSQFYLGKQYKEPDHYARFKAVELGLKVRGKDQPKGSGNQVNIQIINDATHGVFRIIENVPE